MGLLLPPPPPEPVSFRLPNEEEEEEDDDEEDVEEELEPAGLGNLEPPASAVRLLVECRRRKPGAKLELGGVTGVPTAFLSSMLLRLVRDFSVCRGGERGGGGGRQREKERVLRVTACPTATAPHAAPPRESRQGSRRPTSPQSGSAAAPGSRTAPGRSPRASSAAFATFFKSSSWQRNTRAGVQRGPALPRLQDQPAPNAATGRPRGSIPGFAALRQPLSPAGCQTVTRPQNPARHGPPAPPRCPRSPERRSAHGGSSRPASRPAKRALPYLAQEVNVVEGR